jgi:hypothetical protein
MLFRIPPTATSTSNLPTAVNSRAQTTYAAFRFTIRRHVLATATLIGRYGR